MVCGVLIVRKRKCWTIAFVCGLVWLIVQNDVLIRY